MIYFVFIDIQRGGLLPFIFGGLFKLLLALDISFSPAKIVDEGSREMQSCHRFCVLCVNIEEVPKYYKIKAGVCKL